MVRPDLRGKEIIAAIGNNQVKEGINERALSRIVPVLEDNTLRVMQEWEEAEDACDKPHERYAGKFVNNKLTVLKNIFIMKYIKNPIMGHQIASLKSQYARLGSMQTSFDDCTKVAVLIIMLEEVREYDFIIASFSVMSEKSTT